MRHGDAVKNITSYGSRPLSDKGKREACAAGAFLSMAQEMPDVIMHSSQLRSRMTAEHVLAELEAKDVLQRRDDLEEDSSVEDFLSSIVSEFGKTDKKIMAVGHNPFISRLALLLFADLKSSALEELKTGTLLAADSIASGEAWAMRFYMPSKQLTKFYDSFLRMKSVKVE
jgi:phosphohistidine phosphatase SixA